MSPGSTHVESLNHVPVFPAAAANDLHSAIFLPGRQHFFDQLRAGGGYLGGNVGQGECVRLHKHRLSYELSSSQSRPRRCDLFFKRLSRE